MTTGYKIIMVRPPSSIFILIVILYSNRTSYYNIRGVRLLKAYGKKKLRRKNQFTNPDLPHNSGEEKKFQ
jgi:hypothetical protein